MKKKIRKGFLWFLAGFAVFFILRLCYGYFTYPDGTQNFAEGQWSDDSNFSFSVRNYATKKFEKGTAIHEPRTVALDAQSQKYERIGTLRAKTNNFEQDERNIRKEIVRFDALIQFEQRSGLPKQRVLHLGIGVFPDKFDSMLAVVQSVGRLESIAVHKTDKTNEYRELQAKRLSLEKTRDALATLKNHGGRVDELITLENRIFDIEEKLQALGVQLGEFDTENEFCTIKFSLYEGKVASGISFARRLVVAFTWTVKFYLAFSVILVLGALATLAIVVILEKLRWIPTAAERAIGAREEQPDTKKVQSD